MINPSPTFPLFFGKNVKDEYGYIVGKIILIKEESSSKQVLIEHGNGDIISYPLIWFKQDDKKLTLLSPLKFKAQELIEKLRITLRKNQALEELLAEKSLPSEGLSEVEKSFKEELNQLKSEAQIFLGDIDSEVKRYNLQIKELSSALIHLKIELKLDTADSNLLLEAKDVVLKEMERVCLKKRELEELHKKLSSIMLGEKLEVSEVTPDLGGMVSKQKGAELIVRIEDISGFEAWQTSG